MTVKITKTVSFLLIFMAVVQLFRMGLEQIFFIFVQRTPFTDDMATMSAMVVLTIFIVIIAKKLRISLSVFPLTFSFPYILETVLFLFFLVSTPLITGSLYLKDVLLMLYANIVTPVFEELIFRGYVWNKLSQTFKKEWVSYLISSVLFAFWHIGYIEGIAFRISDGLFVVMFWKVITGLCFGLILGLLRLKSKNCYSTILLHGMMNIFGR